MKHFLFLPLILISTQVCAQHSTVLEETVDFVRTGVNNATCKTHVEIRVEDEQGVDNAHFVCNNDSHSKLSTFSGTVTDATGKVVRKVKRSDLQTSEYSRDLANDASRLVYICQPINYPYTVTYDYEEKISNGIVVYPAFVPQNSYDIAVKHSALTITVPADDDDVRYVSEGTDVTVDRSTSADGKSIVYRIESSDLAPIRQKPYALPLERLVPLVKFAPKQFNFESTHCDLSSWQTLGNWVTSLSEGTRELPEAMKRKVHELTDHLSSKREIVKALYDYLNNSTRYVSIQLGIGGYKPATVEQTSRISMGDCKALSNYMVAMLHEAGLPADYVLISTEHKDLYMDMANMGQLNHAIVTVPIPNDTLWLECTNPIFPIGYFPSTLWGHQSIVLRTLGEAEVVRLPQYADTLNKQITNVDISIDRDGKASFTMFQSANNRQYEDNLGMKKWPESKQKDYIQEKINLPHLSAQSFSFSFAENKPEVTWNLAGTSTGFAKKTGSRIFIPLSPVHQPASRISTPDKPYEFVLSYGYVDEEYITLHIPEGMKIEKIPQTLSLSTPFGTFNSCVTQKDDVTIEIHQTAMIKSGEYAAELLNAWLDFHKTMSEEYQKKIVIVGQ